MSAKGKWWSATVAVENCRLSKNTFLATRPVLMHDFKQVSGPYHESLKQMNQLQQYMVFENFMSEIRWEKEATITKQLKNKTTKKTPPLQHTSSRKKSL